MGEVKADRAVWDNEDTHPRPPSPLKGLTVATKLHNQMTGADLHPNAIDGTTGTELTPASQATYDGRYVRTIGGTVTPTVNGTATLRVTKQDGTTTVIAVDTTNGSLLFPTSGDAINLGGGGIVFNQTNGIFHIKSGFTGKPFKIRNSSNIDTFLVDFDSGSLTIKGGIINKRTATATSYTVLVTDYIVGVTSTAAARTITLPAAATATVGKTYIVKDESGAAATNNITVQGNAAETIEGTNTKLINTNYGVLRLYTDGTSWFTF